MTRQEHLDWAKERAFEYCDKGDAMDAYASFVSDIGKHPDLRYDDFLISMGMRHAMSGDVSQTRQFIEGFN